MAKGGGGVTAQPITGGMSAAPGNAGAAAGVGAGGGAGRGLAGLATALGPGGPRPGMQPVNAQQSAQQESDKLYALQMAYMNAASSPSASAMRRRGDIMQQISAMGRQQPTPQRPVTAADLNNPNVYPGGGMQQGGGNKYRDLMANLMAMGNRSSSQGYGRNSR